MAGLVYLDDEDVRTVTEALWLEVTQHKTTREKKKAIRKVAEKIKVIEVTEELWKH